MKTKFYFFALTGIGLFLSPSVHAFDNPGNRPDWVQPGRHNDSDDEQDFYLPFHPKLNQIENIVVIYAENRSFDHLYGNFPGADGLQGLKREQIIQRDRNGSVLKELPVVWGGLTAPGEPLVITEAQTAHLPNATFKLDSSDGFNAPLNIKTRDLVHRFYQDQMQINGGKSDRYVAYADSGALVMGNYDVSKLPLWPVAQRYTLADHFFQGAFGGSFLNHFSLICSCTPYYPDADKSVAANSLSAVEADGVTLKLAANSPASALDGPPKFVNDSTLTPDFYAVNTMQPPYQPSSVKPAAGGDPRYADPSNASTLPPQTQKTIGDLLTAKGVSWAWYGGAWQAALDQQNATPVPNFQFHHQPFNYFAVYAPGTAERAKHLLDGGLNGVEFIKAIDSGTLPHVAFYKPQGDLNEHAGYANVSSGDQHIADIIAHLEKSPQWQHMLVVVTYDENGGWWDHLAPPKGDRWGPGTRIPALIISPFAKKRHIDHTVYDTTSIIRFITKRYHLPVLPGLKQRDREMWQASHQRLGDLTNALELKEKFADWK